MIDGMSTDAAHGDFPERLRELRQLRRRTLSDLSEAAGVSIAHLSRIEKGKRQPSLDVLLRIARSYGMSLGQLTGPDRRGAHEIFRQQGAEPLPQGPHATMRLMSGAFPGLTCVRYDVDSEWTSPMAHHAGEEWIYLISGSVHVQIEDVTEVLRRGDSMHFDAWNPHRLSAGKNGSAMLLVSSGTPIHDTDDGVRHHP